MLKEAKRNGMDDGGKEKKCLYNHVVNAIDVTGGTQHPRA